ncbi:MAG: anaerobic ribonucleoside-triphosphate reductase, partial [Thermoprotei archaeon]
KHVVARTMEFEEEDGYMYNVEETPAESAAYRLALRDANLFIDLMRERRILIPSEGGRPFYSNSIVPYYTNLPITLRAKLEGSVQKEFTGGVMMHLFLYEVPEVDALKKLIYRLVTQTDISYFSITPAISVCRKCGYSITGIHTKCPRCGKDMDIWSRIVGYYRPLRSWHEGRKYEFKTRIHYGSRGAIRAGMLI